MEGNRYSIKWIEFSKSSDAIINIRRKVFGEEYNRSEETLTSPMDVDGLHLGIYDNGTLLSVSTSYIIDKSLSIYSDSLLKPLNNGEVCIQTTKRASLKELRGKGLNEIKEIVMGAQIIDVINPAYFFATLHNDELDTKLDHYKRKFGFSLYKKHRVDGVDITIVISGKENYDFVKSMYHDYVQIKSKELNFTLPALTDFIQNSPSHKHLIKFLDK